MISPNIKLFAASFILNMITTTINLYSTFATSLSPTFLGTDYTFLRNIRLAITIVTTALALWYGYRYSKTMVIKQQLQDILITLAAASIIAPLAVYFYLDIRLVAILMFWTPATSVSFFTGMVLGTIQRGGKLSMPHLETSLIATVAFYQVWILLRGLAESLLTTKYLFNPKTMSLQASLDIAGLIIYFTYLLTLLDKGRTTNLKENYVDILYTFLIFDLSSSLILELANAAFLHRNTLTILNQMVLKVTGSVLRAFGTGFATLSLGYLWGPTEHYWNPHPYSMKP